MSAIRPGTAACSLALSALIGAAGCSTAPSSSTNPASTNAPSPAQSTSPAANSGAQLPLVFGPGSFNVLDATSGLDGLKSYRARLQVSFVGTDGGAAATWTVTRELVQQDGSTRLLTTATTGTSAPAAAGMGWSIQGVLYEQPAGSPCRPARSDGPAPVVNPFAPAARLSAVIGAELAGTETIDGIATEHATFDERSLGLFDGATSTGEVWTAIDAGYLVRYQLKTVGGPTYFGDGVDGTVTWDYRVSDVEQPLTVELPAACAGAGPIPGFADAEDVVQGSGLLSYRTPETVATVTAFYTGKAAELGWVANGEALEADGVAVLEFTSAAGKVTVFATREDGKTKVFVSVDPN